MEPKQPAANLAVAAAEPEEDEADEETEAAKDKETDAAEDEEDALLDRAQALISRVVDQEANPNPYFIHTLATIAEDQEAREEKVGRRRGE